MKVYLGEVKVKDEPCNAMSTLATPGKYHKSMLIPHSWYKFAEAEVFLLLSALNWAQDGWRALVMSWLETVDSSLLFFFF